MTLATLSADFALSLASTEAGFLQQQNDLDEVDSFIDRIAQKDEIESKKRARVDFSS